MMLVLPGIEAASWRKKDAKENRRAVGAAVFMLGALWLSDRTRQRPLWLQNCWSESGTVRRLEMPFSSHFCPSLHKAAVCHFSALNVSVDSSCISKTLPSPHHGLGASRALASVCRFTLMTNSCVPYCSSGVLSVCHFLEPSTLIQFLFPVLRIFDFFFFLEGEGELFQ